MSQAMQQWERLAANPNIPSDEGGFGKHKKRLAIPPNILGEDDMENRAGKFQERALESATKAAKMSSDMKADWLTATGTGFDSHEPTEFSEKSKAKMFTALTARAWGSEAGEGFNIEGTHDSLSKTSLQNILILDAMTNCVSKT